MPLIEALKIAIAFRPETGDTRDDKPDYSKFSECNIPAVLINHPALMMEFIICEDGSMTIVDSRYFDGDFDDLTISSDKPLVDAAAQDACFDALADLKGGSEHHPPSIGIYRDEWALIGVTKAGRRSLGVSDDLPLAEIREHCRNSGGNGKIIRDAIENHSENLEDPLFVPKDEKNWSEEDEKEVGEILTDILLTDPNFEGGGVELIVDAVSNGDALTIDYEPAPHIGNRAIELLNILCLFETRFSGEEWEYNDGAHGRESGYSNYGAGFFCRDFDAPSNHERLAAQKRLAERLKGKGYEGDLLEKLLNAEEEV